MFRRVTIAVLVTVLAAFIFRCGGTSYVEEVPIAHPIPIEILTIPTGIPDNVRWYFDRSVSTMRGMINDLEKERRNTGSVKKKREFETRIEELETSIATLTDIPVPRIDPRTATGGTIGDIGTFVVFQVIGETVALVRHPNDEEFEHIFSLTVPTASFEDGKVYNLGVPLISTGPHKFQTQLFGERTVTGFALANWEIDACRDAYIAEHDLAGTKKDTTPPAEEIAD